MSRIKVTLAVGFALIAAAAALALTRSPPRVVRGGVQGGRTILRDIPNELAVCQGNEVLPAGVSGIRLSMWAFLGPHVHLVVYSGSRVLTEGRRGADWTSDSVTVPVKPVQHTAAHVRVCFELAPNSEAVIIFGSPAPAREAAVVWRNGAPTGQATPGEEESLQGRMNIEYLAPGRDSWWSRAMSVARHVGLGRAFSGTWIALLIVALMAAVGVLAVRLTLRELS